MLRNEALTVCDRVVLEHVLERVVYLAEGGPLGGAPLPAAAHELVDGRRAARGTLHAVPLRHHMLPSLTVLTRSSKSKQLRK